MASLNFITPCFIVSNLKSSVSYYVDKLGFKIWYILPGDDPFFAMIGRDNVSIMLKAVSAEIEPIPNHGRHEWAPWDAYVNTPEPDELFTEFQSRDVIFQQPLHNNTDNLRGFEVADVDGYVLFFGMPLP